ncbi:MAG: hypothetical protein NZ805_00635 [Armatimonadetes bacterium]|nr:hypothetical protein [Armatimonadota bacterium]MDW8027328.1 hypothetical protein [Armatimonadota bacterium]
MSEAVTQRNYQDLVPNHLPNVSKDPSDGKPLRYRKEWQGFKLWSVGDDLTDDDRIKPNDTNFSVWSKAILSTEKPVTSF